MSFLLYLGFFYEQSVEDNNFEIMNEILKGMTSMLSYYGNICSIKVKRDHKWKVKFSDVIVRNPFSL